MWDHQRLTGGFEVAQQLHISSAQNGFLGGCSVLFEARLKAAALTGCFATILAFTWCRSANGQIKPVVSIDLRVAGLPADAFTRNSYKECPYQYLGYRSVEWLDAQRVLVAFNTSSDCAIKDGLLPGSLRLATFDVRGNMLHSADTAYHAGNGIGVRIIRHGGIWIGPGQTVIVEVPSPHLKTLPDSHDRVLAFSDELIQIQEIDSEDHVRIGDGIHLAGVSPDRRRIFFWTTSHEKTRERTCLSYSSVPMTNAEVCALQDLDSIDPNPDMDVVPKGYKFRASPGASTDGLRSSVFAAKNESVFCELFGKFCPSKGRLVVFETNTRRALIKKDLPLDGRAALSLDGGRLAVLEQNRLKIFVVP
jgi:hypothetical protein